MAEKVEKLSEKVVLKAQEEWNKKYGKIEVVKLIFLRNILHNYKNDWNQLNLNLIYLIKLATSTFSWPPFPLQGVQWSG